MNQLNWVIMIKGEAECAFRNSAHAHLFKKHLTDNENVPEEDIEIKNLAGLLEISIGKSQISEKFKSHNKPHEDQDGKIYL
jgi:hypothetical protein